MHLAERNMWRTAAKILWAFEFSEPLDATGKIVPLDVDAYVDGLVREPIDYQVRIKPRSDEHIASIQRELAGARSFLEPYR